MNPLIAALFASSFGRGELRTDPTLVHRFVLSPPSVMERVSRRSLPSRLVVRWKVRVVGGVLHPPAVAPDGAILVAHTLPAVSEYDASGRLQWTAQLGLSPAAISPIVLADGTRLVITERAEAVYLSRFGQILGQARFPQESFEGPPTVSAAQDGSLLVADGPRLTRLDGAARVTQVTTFEQEIQAAFADPPPALVVGAEGAVALLTSDGRLRHQDDLGGTVSAVARLGEDRLLAVRNGQEIVEFDRIHRKLQVRFSDPSLSLRATLAVNPRGQLRVLASSDLLLAFAPSGQEEFRVQVPSFPSPSAQSDGPSSDLTLDPNGNVLISTPGSDSVLVQKDGSVLPIHETACPEPLRPVALGPAALLACRSGTLILADNGRAGAEPSSGRPAGPP